MTITDSLIILAAAIGAVIFLFASDYYYRYLDNKALKTPLVKIDSSRGNEPGLILSRPNNYDKNITA